MRGSGAPSKWLIAFCLLLGAFLGYLTAAVVMSFWSVAAGEQVHRGLFILVWMLAAVWFFAWPMYVYERVRAVRGQRQVMHERIGDLDYDPPALPFLRATPAPRAKDEIDIKAPDIDDRRFPRLLAGGRTAEQRMADHLKYLELKAEMQRAKTEKQKDPDPLD